MSETNIFSLNENKDAIILAASAVAYIKEIIKEPITDVHTIAEVAKILCKYWSKRILIGRRNPTDIMDAYDEFFRNFAVLLKLYSISDNPKAREYAKRVMYRGHAYRIMGDNDHLEADAVVPVFDNKYASWCKKKDSKWINSFFGGDNITVLKCQIKGDYFGLDINAINNEHWADEEIVFPMIDECITEIKYIKRIYNEATDKIEETVFVERAN